MAESAVEHSQLLRPMVEDGPLRDWLIAQRWYASKTRGAGGVELVECVSLGGEDVLVLAIVQVNFATGTHQLYQVPLTLTRDESHASEEIARSGEWRIFDAMAEPTPVVALMREIEAGGELETEHGRYAFRRADETEGVLVGDSAVPMGVEQSNTSVVIDQRLVLKVFRRLEPGINPELEMLRFLTAQRFANIAPLHGWYEYEGQALAGTLGLAQTFLPDAVGGWELALREVGAETEAFLARLVALGEVTARLHNTLASDGSDPAFSPEEPSQEWIALLTATIDEEIERIFLSLPDDDRVTSIAPRGQDVRERLAHRTQIGLTGRMIRTHGDYHLGQTLDTARGWVIIDFEGEPARPLSERRLKRSALRDVAGMLRSFAYVAAAGAERGAQPPPAFEARAREAFLDAYLATVDATLMPAGEAATRNLLSLFELERAIYELQYELNHRPDWVAIPVASISRLLDS